MKKGHIISERYEIIESIGGGGMANVYLATDLILKRDVAVKVLRTEYADDDEFIKRFEREAHVATSLNHPNIVNIYDVGEDGNLLYMVMEYIDGLTLKEYIQQNNPISIENAINIMKQLTNAISYAHANGLIHRDVKPQNVLIDESGTIKITDFGIAMALSATSLTQTNSIVGSVHYISPEQARGGTATKKSDKYALGIVLYELLTGRIPFSGDTPVAIALKHLQTDTPSVKEITKSVENIVLKATAKNPLHRYDSANEMGVALHEALEPENLHVEKFFPPVEEGEETKVIPVISEQQMEQNLQQNQYESDNNHSIPTETKPKKKSFFKNKYFLIITPIVLIGIIAIILFAMLFKTKEVEIPDVVGEYFEDVESELLQLPLKIERELMHSEEFEEGVIIKTNPKAGRLVKENSVIKVYISEGEETVEFDDYVGKNFSQVKRLLEQDDYKEILEWVVTSDEEEGVIINQVQPAPGDEVIPSQTKVIFEIGRASCRERM